MSHDYLDLYRKSSSWKPLRDQLAKIRYRFDFPIALSG